MRTKLGLVQHHQILQPEILRHLGHHDRDGNLIGVGNEVHSLLLHELLSITLYGLRGTERFLGIMNLGNKRPVRYTFDVEHEVAYVGLSHPNLLPVFELLAGQPNTFPRPEKAEGSMRVPIDSESLLQRFLRYVQIDTMANDSAKQIPSSAGQLELGRLLVAELQQLGLADARQDEHGIVTATVPATIERSAPVIALSAHLDTSPETSGHGIRPQVLRGYTGGDLVLPGCRTRSFA